MAKSGSKRLTNSKIWGAPIEIRTSGDGTRKISWLELFYDLVYVIAISNITSYFSGHISIDGFLDYAYLILIIFWSWLNGSFYHDYTGNIGVRSRFITLWQMMFVAALIVCFSSPPNKMYFRSTIALMLLQGYVIYFWFSLNFYNRERIKPNMIYILFYSIALILEGVTLFFINKTEYIYQVRIIFYTSLVFNYAAPFFAYKSLLSSFGEIDLSDSMLERLGLLVTIVFGETVLAVVDGISKIEVFDFDMWILFALCMLIVFILWWIFFDLTANHKAKKGFIKLNLLEYAYIPVVMSLGIISVEFQQIFKFYKLHDLDALKIHQFYFGIIISVFLLSTNIISRFLDYDKENMKPLKMLRMGVMIIAIVIGLVTYWIAGWEIFHFMVVLMALLAVIVVLIVRNWIVYGEIQAEKI